MIYYVINCEFNRINYPELINIMYSNPPDYVIVKALPNPFREHSCWQCHNKWLEEVKLKGHTNLTGEMNSYCPNCNIKSSCSSSWIQENGDLYPFPDPIKPLN